MMGGDLGAWNLVKPTIDPDSFTLGAKAGQVLTVDSGGAHIGCTDNP
jgi:hypothetical protein